MKSKDWILYLREQLRYFLYRTFVWWKKNVGGRIWLLYISESTREMYVDIYGEIGDYGLRIPEKYECDDVYFTRKELEFRIKSIEDRWKEEEKFEDIREEALRLELPPTE